MTNEELDAFWFKAMEASIKAGEEFTRYRFADLVAAAEREACAKACEELELKSADGEWGNYVAGWSDGTDDCAAAIRARGEP